MIDFLDIARQLGKRVDDAEVKELLLRLGELPEITTEAGETHWLRNSGIRLDVARAEIYMIFVYCRIPESWQSVHGKLSPFSGELPMKIKPVDTAEIVRAKLGREPIQTFYEKRPCSPWEKSEEESVIKDLLVARKTGRIPDGALSRSLEKREKEPYDWFVEVYEIENCEVGFCFLISDRQLIGLQLSLPSPPDTGAGGDD